MDAGVARGFGFLKKPLRNFPAYAQIVLYKTHLEGLACSRHMPEEVAVCDRPEVTDIVSDRGASSRRPGAEPTLSSPRASHGQ